MDIAVRIDPVAEGQQLATPDVDYRWDADTTILCATLRDGDRAVPAADGAGGGMSGSVEIEGRDGSWLVLDVVAGSVRSVEVAVWPPVRRRSSLRSPADAEPARVILPGRRGAAATLAAAAGYSAGSAGSSANGVDALEVNTAIAAESDDAERTIHFILGPPRASRRVRVARDLVFDVDERSRLAGLWLLNVPPCPADS